MNDWFQLAIIAFIVVGLFVAIWKGGAANPEGTGRLGRKVTHLSGTVTGLSGRVGHVETELEELKAVAATAKDIETLRAEMAGDRDLAKRTWESVRRIEEHLIEKGLNGK
ncbi:MAG: hypothetical protein KUG65_06010 [Sphingomonadaceae bacterium]|nr:hypothetical protein [Sphingomonadaceae bacterium]